MSFREGRRRLSSSSSSSRGVDKPRPPARSHGRRRPKFPLFRREHEHQRRPRPDVSPLLSSSCCFRTSTTSSPLHHSAPGASRANPRVPSCQWLQRFGAKVKVAFLDYLLASSCAAHPCSSSASRQAAAAASPSPSPGGSNICQHPAMLGVDCTLQRRISPEDLRFRPVLLTLTR